MTKLRFDKPKFPTFQFPVIGVVPSRWTKPVKFVLTKSNTPLLVGISVFNEAALMLDVMKFATKPEPNWSVFACKPFVALVKPVKVVAPCTVKPLFALVKPFNVV